MRWGTSSSSSSRVSVFLDKWTNTPGSWMDHPQISVRQQRRQYFLKITIIVHHCDKRWSFYQRCVSLTIPVWVLMKRPNICADFKLSQLSTLQSYLLIFQWSLSIIVQIFPLWMEKAFILLKYYTAIDSKPKYIRIKIWWIHEDAKPRKSINIRDSCASHNSLVEITNDTFMTTISK